MAATAIKVRKLNNADFWALIQIIRKGGKQAIAALKEADEAQDNRARGMVIFEVGMQYAEQELQELFAKLCGMSKEEFLNEDFDTTLTVMERIVEDNDLGNFIKRVSAIIKKFSGEKK